MKVCFYCKGPLVNGHQVVCYGCQELRAPAMAVAGCTTNAMIRAGKIPHLKRVHVKCTDCDGRAVTYDHRDYYKPAEVEPVCIGCNYRRGPGSWTFINVGK